MSDHNVTSTADTPLLLKPDDAAKALAISPHKLRELTNCQAIPGVVRIGCSIRYSLATLSDWIAQARPDHAVAVGQKPASKKSLKARRDRPVEGQE